MADEAKIKLTGDNKDLKSTLKDSESTVESFGSNVKKVLATIAVAFAAKKIFDFGKELVSLADTQAEAERKLEKQLRNSGDAAGYSAEQLKKRAAELQTMSKFGDEVILGSQTIIARFKEISGENFDRATVAALDLSEALGSDLAGNSKLLGEALANPLKGLGQLEAAGLVFTETEKKMVQEMVAVGDTVNAQRLFLEKLEEKYGGSAAEAADTFSGRMQQLWNRLGDVGEQIGAMLIPALDSLLPILDVTGKLIEQYLVPVVTDVMKSFFDWASAFYKDLKPAFDWLLETAIVVFTNVETIIGNWSDAVGRDVLAFELAFIKSWENIKYWFTEVIPTVIEWFGDHWKEVLLDYVNIQQVMFENMIDNFGSFIDAIKAYLSGEDWELNWKPLTDGFESSITEMPKIAERVKSDTEKVYEDMLRETDQRLNDAYKKNLEKNRKIIENITQPSKRPTEFETPERTKVDTSKIDAARAAATTPATIAGPLKVEVVKKPEEKAEDKGFNAALEDLIGLNSRITAAAASAKPEDKIVGAVKELKDVAKQTHVAAREQVEMQREIVKLNAKTADKFDVLNSNLENAIGLA